MLPRAHEGPWLFSRNVDLSIFLGSAGLSFAALCVGALTGILHEETPTLAWVPAVILCDVAHVWSTAFRTYLDPRERAARRPLLIALPLAGLAASFGFMWFGESAFWRALAYAAIFHFVRQQYGWVSLYRARASEVSTLGRVVDTAAIYAATLFPLLYWHTHLPRRFSWFVTGDVIALPPWLLPTATVMYVISLSAYALRSIAKWIRGTGNPGKDIVVATTAMAWYVGIVHFNSDYAFTVTNVFMHGIPYFALVYVHSRTASANADAKAKTPQPTPIVPTSLGERLTTNVFLYLGALWFVAFIEELLWDRAVWHERSWLFGEPWDLASARFFLVPILALPQLTHYLLDGFIWRRRSNPSVAYLVSADRNDVAASN